MESEIKREMVSAARLLWELNAADDLPTDPEVKRVAGLEVSGKDVAPLALGAAPPQRGSRAYTGSEGSNRVNDSLRILNRISWDTVTRSTFLWFFVLIVSFIVMVFVVILVASFGLNPLLAMQVGSPLWGFAGVVWTVTVFLRRGRIARRLHRPVVAFPPPPVAERSKLARRHALASAVSPTAMVATWTFGGYLIGSALVVPLFLAADGGGPPIWLVVLSRGFLYLALGLLLLAICLGPWMYARGRLEYDAAYEAAGGIEAATVSEKLGALAERAAKTEKTVTELGRLQRLLKEELGEDVAKRAELENKIKALEEIRDINVRGIEDEMAELFRKARTPLRIDLLFSVGSAVLGTILGYVASIFLPPELFR